MGPTPFQHTVHIAGRPGTSAFTFVDLSADYVDSWPDRIGPRPRLVGVSSDRPGQPASISIHADAPVRDPPPGNPSRLWRCGCGTRCPKRDRWAFHASKPSDEATAPVRRLHAYMEAEVRMFVVDRPYAHVEQLRLSRLAVPNAASSGREEECSAARSYQCS